jgi:hypothetical protein
MANGTTTRTRNLRLFLSSGLTAEARANLEIIDRLADNTFIESTETITFRAKTNMVFQPAADDLNGTANTGTMSFGTVNNKVATMDFHPVSLATFHTPIKIKNILTLTSADTIASTLTLNTGGVNRILSLGGNFTTGHNISLLASGSATATLLPGEQTLVNTDSPQTLSNKTIDSSNSINLTGKITNSDVSASANIAYSKLVLTNSIRATDFTNIPGEQLSYSQVNLLGQLRNTDWSANPLHKLAGTKVDTDFQAQEVITSGGLSVRNASNQKATIKAPANIPNNYEFILPSAPGTIGQALAMLPPAPGQTQIALGWVSTGTTFLQTGEIYVGLGGTPTPSNPGVLNSSDIIASVAEGLVLKPSGVTSGTYGSATQSSQVTVDTKGRVTVAAPVAIDHDLLASFVADEHVAHTSVSINPAANGGLSGGGDISATRTLSVDPTVAVAKASPVGADTILLADSADSNTLKKTTLSALSSAIGVQSFKANWTQADTDPFVVTHNLGSVDTIVQVVDTANGETIGLNSILRTTNTVTLSGQNKPATFTWRVLILKV